ncbi:acyl-CoA carboxylase subunit epsilon [Streptomyces sp. NPDC006476]|uniref:acyl-CoA carboxylase subunit epsilon n=1 Tax=Streptomyces sp. NPDC006476 TaxID=3157175 RepID=UPI0033BBCA1B
MDAPFSLAIVRGHPTAEELAAVTAVLLARLRAAAGQEGEPDGADGVFDEPARKAGWGGGRPRPRPPVGWSRR